MKLYWSIHSIPELNHLPEVERRKLFQFYARRVPLTWQFWVVSIPYLLILFWIEHSYGLCAALLGLVVLVLIKLQIFMRIIRVMIKAHLKEGRHVDDG